MNSSITVVEGLSRRRQGPGGKYNHHEASSCYNNYVLRPLLILFTTKKKKNRLTLIVCVVVVVVVVFGLLLVLSTTTNYNNDSYYSSMSSSSTSNLVVNKRLAEIATTTNNVTAVTATTTTTTTIAEKERTASNSQNGPETTTTTSSNTVPSLLPVIPNTTTSSSFVAASNNPTNAKNNNVVVDNVVDNNNKNNNKKKKKKVIYSFARTDRSGSAIQDMLFCHAYAFQNNLRYGGACASNWELPQYQNKRHDRELLLKSIGLDDELPLACPPPSPPPPPSAEQNNNKNKNNTTKPKPTKNLINRKLYTKQDTLIFTPEYQKYLHSLVKYPQNQRQNDQKLIVVHIRRGDVDPCRPRTYGYPRYIPNYQYIKLIDRYYTTNSSSIVVKIFSESTSFENFDDFKNRGYDVILDGDIGLVWKSIIEADITILSRSSFSFVPAILSKGIIVYTPFWHQPLKSWHIVDDKLLNETHTEFRKLKELCPPKDNNKKKKKKKKNQGGGGGGKKE